jgi:hypothetical protein|tara:strand:+ start:234 stop:848 length:615 start_codon:yes stop_codon:yes gene_type:complete
MPRVSNKKCIPGLFCIENMTMFLLFVLIITVIYMYYTHLVKPSLGKTNNTHFTQPVILMTPQNNDVAPVTLAPVSSRTQPLENVYSPPLKKEGPGLPINISTRGPETSYTQVGLLTRENSQEDLILPLMGRKSSTNREKYQYYSMTNSAGNINTKLPISVKGKSCTADLGCDEIFNGDAVFVEGYKDTFRATIYENVMYKYIPW